MIQKNDVIIKFNEKRDDVMIFFIFLSAFIEFNIQEQCRHIHSFENAINEIIRAETIERNKRFEISNILIVVYDYSISKILDDFVFTKNFQKTISKIAFNFSRNLMMKNEIESVELKK